MARRSDPPKYNVLRISDEETLSLIIHYGNEPCLWNTSLEDYKNKEARLAAAQRIAEILNIPSFDAKHVMIKFKNLRNSYCQELKKIAASVEAGLTGDMVYKPKVFWFHHMDYIRPYLQPTRSKLIVDGLTGDSFSDPNEVPTCRTIQIHEDDSDSSQQDGWIMPNPEQVLIEVPTRSTKRYQYQSSEDEQFSSSPKESKLKRPRKESDHNCLEQPVNCLSAGFLKTIAGNLEQLTRQKDDHFESFGRYVASVLRAMPAQQAMELQPRIVSLITTGLVVDHPAVSQSDDL